MPDWLEFLQDYYSRLALNNDADQKKKALNNDRFGLYFLAQNKTRAKFTAGCCAPGPCERA